MNTLNKYLSSYGVSHKNTLNKKIHYVFVPLIVMSVIGLLMSIPYIKLGGLNIDWSILVIVMALGFYFRLSKKYGLIMAIFLPFLYLANLWLATHFNLLYISLWVFGISWIMQFVGHKIEGQKPSFLEDLQFLLIGPLWVFKSLFNITD
jgi:uncharacterized membrane protein YGL010W